MEKESKFLLDDSVNHKIVRHSDCAKMLRLDIANTKCTEVESETAISKNYKITRAADKKLACMNCLLAHNYPLRVVFFISAAKNVGPTNFQYSMCPCLHFAAVICLEMCGHVCCRKCSIKICCIVCDRRIRGTIVLEPR
jgi:hypothetical protein